VCVKIETALLPLAAVAFEAMLSEDGFDVVDPHRLGGVGDGLRGHGRGGQPPSR